MPNGIFINPKDVMKLKGHSTYNNAWRYLNNLAKEMNKPSASSITIDEFCKIYRLEKSIVLKALES